MASSRHDLYPRSSPEDVSIRSSDNVIFYVHRPVLAYASPIFKDMFDLCTSPPLPLPPPSEDEATEEDDNNDIQTENKSDSIITLSEPASTLSILFHHLDPILSPPPKALSIDELWMCMIAAVKYQMDGVLTRLRIALTWPTTRSATARRTASSLIHNGARELNVALVTSDPFPASVLAFQFGFVPELRMALKEMAKCHIRFLLIRRNEGEISNTDPGSSDNNASAGSGRRRMMWEVGVPLVLLQYILQLRRARALWFISKVRLLYKQPTMQTIRATTTHNPALTSSTSWSWFGWASNGSPTDVVVDGNGNEGRGCAQCMRYRALHLHEVCKALVDHPSWTTFRHQLFHRSPPSSFLYDDADSTDGNNEEREGEEDKGLSERVKCGNCGLSTIPFDENPRFVFEWTNWERDAARLEQELPVWPPPLA
ncbi:hypothetical protein FRC18_011770 [Serendipita sp. 400]|nr:hypothetical protein FRC18_011770 [Serendipita sp. 400]